MTKSLRLLAAGTLLTLLAFPIAASADAFDVAATGLSASGSAQQLGKASDYGSSKVTISMPGENPVLEGVNPLTGEAYDGEYQPVLVNIDTHPGALPHWGVSAADLTYEMPIQADGSTRSLALFMGEIPENGAGPVRSARIPMCSLREMWGGVYCFYGYQGGTTDVKEWVKNYSANRKFTYPYVDGMTKNTEWFQRTSDSSHVAPYNVRLDVNAALESYAETPAAHPFIFTEAGLEHGEDVNGVVISYKTTSPAYVSAYQYNEETGLYDRYRNGEAYVDGDNGEQCSYANVIVLRTDITFMNGNNARPVIRLHGEGVCEIFQNGKYIRGSWARESTENADLNSRMVFFDDQGNELHMKTGKTFIQIVDNAQPVVVIADEAIDGAVTPQAQRASLETTQTQSSVTAKPKATRTPKPTATPQATATPDETAAPEATATPEPTEIPDELPTEEPAPESTDSPAQEATPSPEDPPAEFPTDQPEQPQPDDGNGETDHQPGEASPGEASM